MLLDLSKYGKAFILEKITFKGLKNPVTSFCEAKSVKHPLVIATCFGLGVKKEDTL
jgi:hypothetical protein